MGENTKIEWCDHTFNPWIGCSKVSPGCAKCYAEELMEHRYGKVKWGPNGTRALPSDAYWKNPVTWNRKASQGVCPTCNGGRKAKTHESGYGYEVCPACNGTKLVEPYRLRIFCASLADVFEDRPDLEYWRSELFRLIDATPNLDWLLLTKRPENIRRMWVSRVELQTGLDEMDCRKNVWLGTSIENTEQANKRIPELLKCRDLSPVLCLSAEPLLGPIDLRWKPWAYQATGETPREYLERNGSEVEYEALQLLDWVIVGGESGPGARPCNVDWIRLINSQCADAGVPCFVKQLGSNPVASVNDTSVKLLPDAAMLASGRLPVFVRHPKGGDPSEWPEDLRVREFPKVLEASI